MKIGDFAKQCHTQVSVLRHYDKLGLLRPIHVDKFTGYRYYQAAQITVFSRIGELKAAGFTLAEIKTILYSPDQKTVQQIVAQNQKRLQQMLQNLKNLKPTLSGGIHMKQQYKPFIENIDLPFINDEPVIGRWKIEKSAGTRIGDGAQELYFLPDGERYWCYGWTKGKFLFSDGINSFANDYRLETRGNDLYMTIFFKSYDYPETGDIIPITLKKLDSGRYTAAEIARKDDINKPFVADDRVLGRWISVDLLCDKAEKRDYDPSRKYCSGPFYFKEITFSENGLCRSVYGDEVISGEHMQTWTKGYLLRKWNHTACAYEIRQYGDTEYLIIEWKSGDYRWGNRETDYYVLIRA